MVENAIDIYMRQLDSGVLGLPELIGAAASLSKANEAPLALDLYRNWIERHPQDPLLYVAYFNYAVLTRDAGDVIATLEALKQAIALNADFVPAYINLGRLLENTGAPDQAVEVWRTAISRPVPITGQSVQYAITVLKQTVRLLSSQQLHAAAEEAVRLCLDIDPHQRDVIEQLLALRLGQCKWPTIEPWGTVDRGKLMHGIHPLSAAAYTDDPLFQLALAERNVRLSDYNGPQNPELDRRHAAIDLTSRRLRVGYVSSDLRDHAIGYLMAELFDLHQKSDVEVFAYYCGPPSNSALTARIRGAVEHWIDIRDMSDDEAARKIGADSIDVLVDVNGHTSDARTGVFARRAAPVQVNWLGFPGTMGSPYHQYIIADDWIIPEGSEIYYSETVARLPCYQPNDRKRQVMPERPTRRDAGLPDDAFVFCCFNGAHKISRPTFDRWLEIMNRTQGSVLWLLATSAEPMARLGDIAERNGVSRNRIVFAPRQHNALHLARYPLADLFLDTAPYGAHTTASDALWMGVPMLTLSGRSFASRVCGSLLRSAGLADLVVTSPREYVERAVALAANRSEIEGFKARSEANRDTCTVFDTDLLVRHLEELYRTMCREHQKGLQPQPDLSNLDAYLEAAIAHDHEAHELLGMDGYHEQYRERLGRLHLARPMPPDNRLWTSKDIAKIETSDL